MPGFQFDSFLSSTLERPVVRIIDSAKMKPEWFRGRINGMVFGQADCRDMNSTIRFQQLGFRLIDTNIQLEMPLPLPLAASRPADPYRVRFAETSDEEAVGKIAGDSFDTTRFHLDPVVENRDANEIKRVWALNFFCGQRGDQMVVAVKDDQPVGFLQLLYRENQLVIDLVAVNPDHQGRHLAGKMIQFASLNCGAFKSLKVGTQIANTRSIRVYQRLGFLMAGSSYNFHYHGPISDRLVDPTTHFSTTGQAEN